jgi:hypothetical protein
MTTITCMYTQNPNWAVRGLVHAGFLLAADRVS